MFTLHRLRHSVANLPKTAKWGQRGWEVEFFCSFFIYLLCFFMAALNLAVVEKYYFNMSLILTHGQEPGVKDTTQ